MQYSNLLLIAPLVLLAWGGKSAAAFEKDTIPTTGGDLAITFIGHSSVQFEWGGKVIQVDPCTSNGDYSTLPRADLVLVTHEHGDHLDAKAIAVTKKPGAPLIWTEACAKQGGAIEGAVVMKNGETRTAAGIGIQAVPAYNIVNMRGANQPYHPKGTGNGYILTFGDVTVYLAGDTENIPEMKTLGKVTIAFLPMNLPFTMTPEMAADAARMVAPKVLYPYHYGQTDTGALVKLLTGSGIDIRIRNMK